MNNIWRVLSMVFAVCLVGSVGFNIYQYFQGVRALTKTFVYEWPYSTDFFYYGGQVIVNETLRLEITFESVNDSLNVVARINDDDYCEIDMLGLVLDRSGNGFIDVGEEDHPYMFFAGNVTYYHDVLLHKDGIIECDVQIPPQHSVYHTCTFTEGLGYTFKIHIPKRELSHVKANMVYVSFWDTDELKGYPWGPWVSIMIEGWR